MKSNWGSAGTKLASTMLTAAACSALLVSTSPAANAGCVTETYWKVTRLAAAERPTDFRSAYIEGPAKMSHDGKATARTKATVKTTASIDVNAVIAKASRIYGIALRPTWSLTDTWTFSMDVPSGKTARVVMYHESRKIYAVKKRITQSCQVQVIGRATINAPTKSGYNRARLDYL